MLSHNKVQSRPHFLEVGKPNSKLGRLLKLIMKIDEDYWILVSSMAEVSEVGGMLWETR